MASSEALSIVQFARLSRGNDDDRDREFPANAKRPHPTEAMPLCAPPSSVYDESRDVVAGIAFRAVGGSDVEAVRVEPPVMTSSGNDADGHEGGERVGANRCVDGGGFEIIGRLSLGNNTDILRMACSNDARFLIVACSDGTLICLSVTYYLGVGESEERAVRFQRRWEMNATNASVTPSRRSRHIDHDGLYRPDGSDFLERRRSQEDVMPSNESVVVDDGPIDNDNDNDNDNDTKGTTGEIHFPTLEFFTGTDKKYNFLAVAEDCGRELSHVLWMDAASSSSDIPPSEASSLGPPPWNVWPFHNPDLVNVGKGDIADSIPHRITCAAVFPGSSDNGAAQEPDTIFAVGTNKGCLGMVSASARGAAKVIFLDHPLMQPCQEDDHRGLPHWKITHLHWLESRTLAVGLSRVIANTDSKKEEGGEDDSNEHQASFLMGTVIAEGDGDLDPRNSSSWSWSVLGDVVPFVSVPKGGHYSFHTALLPGNRTSTASTALVLVGCNVASEVAVLSRRGNNEWAKLDLMEGNHLACPTDEKDEYKFLMGLTVVLLPLRLAGVNDNGNDLCYPFFMLTATDGSLLGFAPFHRTLGERFFARPWNAVEMAAVENTFKLLAEMSNKVEASKLDVGLRSPTNTPAAVSSQREQTSEERANSQSRDGCCLSGLDLGLQSAIEKKPVMETPDEDEADSDPDACRFDYAEASSSARRLSNEQVQVCSAAEKENNDAPSSHQRAYRSGTSALPMNLEAPAFSLRRCSTINPIQTKTTDIVAPRTSSGGFTSGSTGDATFRSTSALEGGIRKSSTNPSFPIQQQHAASATLSLPVFGSGTVESRVGCESLKPSTGSSLSGMGSTSESKLSVFGSDADSSAGLETVSKKASRNAKKKAEKEGEKVSTRHIDRDSSIKSPIFEFKSTEGGLASFVHPPSPENNILLQPDAFNSFRDKYDSSNPVLAPGSLKPLFDVKNNENEDSPVESSENHLDREEGRDQEKDVSSHVDDNSKNINKLIKTPAGSRALKAYNAVVSHMGETDVILPSTQFEAVVEALGEGFHGEELEKQLSFLDPMKSGRIERDAFVKWYCKLVDQKVESSQNSDVAEKKAKAEEAFSNICDNSGDTINASDFAKLLESMGITYCEEKHRRTIKKISEEDSSSGEKVIKKRVFVRWFVDWLFGDGDCDEKSEAGSGASDAASLNKEFKETSEGWGSLLKTSDTGFWRCKVCMVTNGPSVVICSSCETMKLSSGPNLSSDNASASATEPKPLSSCHSIGAGGFSFGGSSNRSSIDTGEFTFGGSNPLLSNSILETQKPSSISEPKAGAVPASNTGRFNFASATDNEAKGGVESKFASKRDNTETTEKSSSTSSSSSSNYPSMSSAALKPIGTSPTKNDEAKSKTSSAAYPPQNECRENSTRTANKHEPDDILDGQRTINPPIHNPYASSRKRNIHQIMKRTSSNSINLPTSTTSSATAISTIASGTTSAPVAKRVFNPYAKANSAASSGSIVRNPYSSSVNSTAFGPDVKSSNTNANGSNTSSQFSNKEESGSNSERKSNISVKTQTHDDCKKVNPFGQRGISLSLPFAERLPSRNVSFRSAEILTVGELYRYLYDPKNGDTGRQNQITSVRITGTLLCVSMPPVTDDSDASGSALYDKGRFLIVGDPLERIQNPVTSAASASLQESSENDAFQQDRKNTPLVTPSTKSKLKTMPSSILRNKKTPAQKPTIAVFATPKPKHVTTLGGRKSTPRGLLSTGAKKKFVYAGNTKKSPSSLLGGGGLSKKFSTPTSMTLKESRAIRNDSQLDIKRENPTMRSLQQRSLLRLGAVAAGASGSKDRNPKPELVIQRHASPMVPIWIGSTFDGDGLDGSVVGDLVLIMGEIVNDKCLCCDLDSSKEHTRGSSSDQGDDKKLIEGDNNTIEVKGIKDAAKYIAHRAASISPKSQGLQKKLCECTQFVCARFVKNANGTDLNLLKESLEVRRQYIANRKRQIEMFLPAVENLYSVGLGITTNND